MVIESINRLTERIVSETIPKNNRRLVNMILSENISEKEFDEFLAEWDVENNGATGALQMTFLVESHPELTFPNGFYEELKRHLGFYIWKRSEFQKNCPVILDALLKAGIVSSLFKGSELFLTNPSILLEMRDVDVIVIKSRWKEAGKIISKLGYEIVNWDNHSFDVHVKGDCHGLIDVHRYFPPISGKERKIMKDVLSRTREASLFGVSCRTLCPEDLVFTYLGNLYRNLTECRRPQSLPCNIINIGKILKTSKEFDWRIVKNDALLTGTGENIAFAINYVNAVVPGMLPQYLLSGLDRIGDMVAFRRYILCYLQARSHGLKVKTIMKKPELIPAFLKIRPLYTVLKLLRKSQWIARLSLRLARRLKGFSI